MTRQLIQCPHCQQALQVDQDRLGKSLRCPRCKEKFKSAAPDTSAPRSVTEAEQSTKVIPGPAGIKRVRFAEGKQVVGVACQSCDERFGVKPEMSAKPVVCPACSHSQRFELVAKPSSNSSTDYSTNNQAEVSNARGSVKPSPDEAIKPDSPAKIKRVADIGSRATVVHTSTEKDDAAVPLTEKAKSLLPPKYLVDEAVERVVLNEAGLADAGGIQLGIDPEVTRIERDGQTIEIKSLTARQKRFRRRVRVGIVYFVSIVILVVWLVWLLQRVESP